MGKKGVILNLLRIPELILDYTNTAPEPLGSCACSRPILSYTSVPQEKQKQELDCRGDFLTNVPAAGLPKEAGVLLS